jgi:hypothetical protein
MNESMTPIIIFVLAAGWIFVLIRHGFLVRFPFRKHMSKNHPVEWESLKNDSNWTATWIHPYYSQAVYNFIWRSQDNFNDPIVEKYKKQIRWSGWHIPLYFIFVGCCGVLIAILENG